MSMGVAMLPAEVRTSPKKARIPRQSSLPFRAAILAVAANYKRLTIRQLFYQLVVRDAIPKTEAAYKRVCDASAQMRLDGSLPYSTIADESRTRRVVYAHANLLHAIDNAHALYRRNYWLDQPVHVEVWSEKAALTGVILPTCERYGVTFVATRGFPSITLRYESARAFMDIGKPTRLFYFGDHDASGQQISANLEAELRQHGAEVVVERVALNPSQIRAHGLPTRPGKTSDSRHAAFAAQFGGASVELDALPPDVLVALVEDCIESQIDADSWQRAKEVERLELKTFASLAAIDWTPELANAMTERELS